jgi:hypothetical protein
MGMGSTRGEGRWGVDGATETQNRKTDTITATMFERIERGFEANTDTRHEVR